MKLIAKRHQKQSLDILICVLFALILFNLIENGSSLKISPKRCSNAVGDEGTCMFVWECIKTEGRHLGTCVDGFLFGSCCGHNDTSNDIDVTTPFKPSALPVSSTSSFSTTTTTTTSSSTQSSLFLESVSQKPQQVFTASVTTAKPYIATVNSVAKPTQRPYATNSQPTITQNVTTTQTIWKPPAKPWPPPIHIPGQMWPYQTSTPTLPTNILHTFRPPAVFPGYASHRPHPSVTLIGRPTFRPPAMNRPTVMHNHHYFNSRISSTTTAATTTSTPRPKPGYYPHPSASNVISQSVHNKKPVGKVQCGVPQLHPQSKVVGGKNAAFGSWPWQVSVRRTSFFGFSSTHRCGGAILNQHWIATAGHCVDDLLLSQIRIRVGEYDFASVMEPYPYLERGAKKKVVHPHYNFFTYENDVALVQLDEAIEFQPHIGPICLPPDNINLEGRNATVTGWGRLSEGGILPSVLQEVKVPIVSNDKCKSMFLTAGRHEYIPEIFMCAGYAEGGRDSCQGDSGGPLQVQGDDNKWFLAGIISWGIGCAEPNLPGVCTRISKFKSWIQSTIA